MLRQLDDVFRTLAQWRDDDFDDVQAEIQIAAKAALADRFFQIAVGSRNHADIHFDGAAAPDALKRMPLQHAQEFRLDGGTHLADFIQHQRAFVRRLEFADLAIRGPGKSTPFVAEQFTLQQGFGECGAVEADKGALFRGLA